MFSGLFALPKKFSLQVRRSARGAILLGWILLLIFLAGLAAAGKASESVMSIINRADKFFNQVELYLMPSEKDKATPEPIQGPSPLQHLDNYKAYYEYPPPIEAVIHQMIKKPSWGEINLGKAYDNRKDKSVEKPSDKKEWIKDQYYQLFGSITSKLQAVASDQNFDIAQPIESPVIPDVFRKLSEPSVTKAQTINLTREGVAWIKEERMRREARQQRYALVDSFFLLMVIGAFGSLIFLSKDFIEHQEATSISSLIFRPILGMFLAMAVFIVSMFGHALISTADILKIRTETLYLLALAAGMLSEQAYELVKQRASAALDKLTKDEEPEEHTENNPQPSQPPKT